MKTRIAELIAALRRSGVRVSVAEAIDAAAAAAAVGVERSVLRDALAATLIKDARDRSAFEDAFARVFPSRPPAPPRRGARRPGGILARGGPGGGAGGSSSDRRGSAGTEGNGSAEGGTPHAGEATTGAEPAGGIDRRSSAAATHARDLAAGASRPGVPGAPVLEASSADSPRREDAHAGGPMPGDERGSLRGRGAGRASGAAPDSARDDDLAAAREGAASGHVRDRRARELLTLPFRSMSPRDVDEAAELARALARRFAVRLRRRLAPRVRGRLDFRRTLRAAVPRGGTPFERHYRGRRPGRPGLIALCDLSASAATAADFFLALLAPAHEHFARVQLFGFVDRLVEIEFVGGRVQPAGPIDLMARSDFGRVLSDLMSESGPRLSLGTVLLVLGDARNNRRPPRADLLGLARTQVRRLVWMNPDPPPRWNSGDSVIAAYARHADAVVPCGSLAELDRALAAIARL